MFKSSSALHSISLQSSMSSMSPFSSPGVDDDDDDDDDDDEEEEEEEGRVDVDDEDGDKSDEMRDLAVELGA